MPDDTFLMGLMTTNHDKSFVYIVTNSAIGELKMIHSRMPLVVDADERLIEFDAGDEVSMFEQ
jgi:putative SOS response-associated peptidase YedK